MCGLSNRNYLRQTPNVVNGKYSLTKSESDLVYMLLTEIDKNDEDFKDYIFTKEELENKVGSKIHSKQLYETAKSLMQKVIEIKKSSDKWELMNWFSYFSYDEGVITCGFDKRLKPYLLDMKQYILTDIRHLMQIKSDYSRRIYLMLKEREKFGIRKFNVEELMEILQVPKSYLKFKNFKIKVLNQAVRDINKYTDIEIKNIGTEDKPVFFEEHKRIRKVTHITFYNKKNWLNDSNTFIAYMRKNFVNKDILEGKDKETGQIYLLSVSEKGHLYDKYGVNFNSKKSKELWDKLYKLALENKIYCLQKNLID